MWHRHWRLSSHPHSAPGIVVFSSFWDVGAVRTARREVEKRCRSSVVVVVVVAIPESFCLSLISFRLFSTIEMNRICMVVVFSFSFSPGLCTWIRFHFFNQEHDSWPFAYMELIIRESESHDQTAIGLGVTLGCSEVENSVWVLFGLGLVAFASLDFFSSIGEETM